MELPMNSPFMTEIHAHDGNLQSLIWATEAGYRKSNQAVALAAAKGHVECIEYMLQHNYKIHHMAVFSAVHYNQLECVKILLPQSNVSKSKYQVLKFFAQRNNNAEMLDYLVMNER